MSYIHSRKQINYNYKLFSSLFPIITHQHNFIYTVNVNQGIQVWGELTIFMFGISFSICCLPHSDSEPLTASNTNCGGWKSYQAQIQPSSCKEAFRPSFVPYFFFVIYHHSIIAAHFTNAGLYISLCDSSRLFTQYLEMEKACPHIKQLTSLRQKQ